MWETLFIFFMVPVIIGGIVRGVKNNDWSLLAVPGGFIGGTIVIFGGAWFLVWLLSLLK